MVIKTPIGTIVIRHKATLALEKIKTIDNQIDNLAIVTMSNTHCIIGTSVLAAVGLTAGIVANARTKKLSKKLSEMESVQKEEEE